MQKVIRLALLIIFLLVYSVAVVKGACKNGMDFAKLTPDGRRKLCEDGLTKAGLTLKKSLVAFAEAHPESEFKLLRFYDASVRLSKRPVYILQSSLSNPNGLTDDCTVTIDYREAEEGKRHMNIVCKNIGEFHENITI